MDKSFSSVQKGVLFATVLGSGMAFLASTTISIALPAIQDAFNTTLQGIQWVSTTYVIALAALMITGGSLGDQYGRKKVFLIGTGIFAVGSLISAFSSSVGQLVTFQALQGIGAALMIPGSLAVINVCFPEAIRGRAIGIWSGFSAGLAATGPFIGGVLVQNWGWSSVYFLNVPIAIITFGVAYKYMPETRDTNARKLDIIGTVLIALSLFGLAFGLIQGPTAGFGNTGVLISLIGGAVGFMLFLFVESRSSHPMMPLSIFKNKMVAGANLSTFLLYFALNGLIFFVVLNFQQVQGYTPILTGLALLPPIVIITFFSGRAGAWSDKVGARLPMMLGPALVGIGMLWIAFAGVEANYFLTFLPGQILFGSGMALAIAPLTKSALDVEPKNSGVASGINNAVARGSALFAIVILGGVIVSLFSSHLQSNIEDDVVLNSVQKELIVEQSDKLGGIKIPDEFGEIPATRAYLKIKQSFVYGFRWAMIINAIIAFLAVFVAWKFIDRDKLTKSHTKI